MTLVTILGAALPQAAAQQPPPTPSVAKGGMVSSAHPLATRAGLALLAQGGNAFDAAIAVAATLNVVEPMMSGIGGYGTILLYDSRRRELRFLNPSGRIPRAVDSDAFRAPTPGYLENRRGAKAVSTPGNLHAWEALARKYGSRPWSTLFDSAVAAAEDGYQLSERQAEMIADAFSTFPSHAKAIYGRDGAPLAAGDRLVQRDLARSLRLIAAQGARVLYGGQLGRAVDSAMRAAGGFLSLQDLELDKAEWYRPISLEYRGYQVYTASPPANAFDALARLGMMSRYDLAGLGHNSAGYLHRYAEVTKLGFWLRLRYAGDPEVKPPPVERLLSNAYLDSLVSRIDTARASRFVPPGVSATELPPTHTTHFVVADRWGNVVSATQTIGNLFGSRIMPEGTGIWLNNSLEYSTFEPKGNPMDAFAGRHKLSGDVPTIVMRNGRPWAAVGTPGGHSIGQTVPQMLINLIDFGMDVQAAIAAPRISFSEPDELVIESGVPEAVRDRLVALGHRLRVLSPGSGIGNAHGLAIEYDAQGHVRRFTGGADPRGDGLAEGPSPEPVPMREETYHRLVFENQQVAVYDVRLPLGAVMRYHEHPTNHLAIVIDSGTALNEVLGRPGKVNPIGPVGTVVYLGAGPPHRQTNIGHTEIHFIAVELLSPEGKAAAKGVEQRARPDGAVGCHVVIDQPDIRAWRCAVPPGQAAPSRPASGPFLRILVSPGPNQAAGTATWHQEPATIAMTNEGSSPVEFVDLEWK